jgi:16S rRNA (guanine527-N7)-methyltransferase
MRDITLLNKMSYEFNIELTDKQIQQFILFYEMLIETNKVMNLTAITEFEEVICKHFIDSLSLVKLYNINNGLNLIDIGTGAGFPGIPLKIVFPDIKVILLDSLNKRVKFLNDVINSLGLNDIYAFHGRAEEFGNNIEYREKFDLCVSRAVARMVTLSEYCLPFVKLNGHFISYKAGNMNNELDESKKAITILGGKLIDSKSFQLPGTDIERTLIKIKKINTTPKKYPRSSGKPVNAPIK